MKLFAFQYLLINYYQDEKVRQKIHDAFTYFIHEPVTIVPEIEMLLIGKSEDEIDPDVDLDNPRLLTAENYFDSIRGDVENAESEITENTNYLVLNLARVLAFKKDGLVLSKLEGGKWALENIPAEYQGIIEAALAEYESGEPAPYDKSQAVNYAKSMLGLIF